MKIRTVIIYHGNNYVGEYTRDRRLSDGEWSAGTAPTSHLRALVRRAGGERRVGGLKVSYRVHIGEYVLVINYQERAKS